MQAASFPEKNPELSTAVDALRERLGKNAFVIVDHWPEDPDAIGIAAPGNQELFAYVSASTGADEPYFVSLEFPTTGDWADHSYTPGDDRNVCELDELIDAISKHLQSKPKPG
ncbi:MAG: hypothetical protein ABW136_05385 [Steroidobacteraceae bacterium]